MKTPQPLSYSAGQLPPQAPEMEVAVMGALLLESTALGRIQDLLRPEDFYDPAHRMIFQAILNLNSRQHPVDMLTVTKELTRMKVLDQVGGPYYISQLTSQVASTSHLPYHALAVRERADARELIRITTQIASKAYDPGEDIDELRENLEKELTALATRQGHPASQPLSEVLRQVVDRAQEAQQKHQRGEVVAISTGLPELDKAMNGGLHQTDLITLAGRPSMGKTQMGLFFAKSAAAQGHHALFCSIEMDRIPVAQRYILEEEAIDPAHLRTGQMDSDEWNALDRQVGKLWNLNLHIAADADICFLRNIRSEARRLKRLGQLDLLVIDQLSHIRTGQKFERRYLEVGFITKELKRLAKELNIPVVLIAQINRPLKGVKPEEPRLEDLRESGDIEQDADVVIFVHKPDYYFPHSVDGNGKSWKNRGKLLIAKQRDGVRQAEIIFCHDSRYKKIYSNP